MKNIDKIELGKRLFKYFIGCGCHVSVYRDILVDNRGKVRIIRESKWTGKDFQTHEWVIAWESNSKNDNFDKISRLFVEWYCQNDKIHGYGQRSNNLSDILISASSPEELDLKLTSRGY